MGMKKFQVKMLGFWIGVLHGNVFSYALCDTEPHYEEPDSIKRAETGSLLLKGCHALTASSQSCSYARIVAPTTRSSIKSSHVFTS